MKANIYFEIIHLTDLKVTQFLFLMS